METKTSKKKTKIISLAILTIVIAFSSVSFAKNAKESKVIISEKLSCRVTAEDVIDYLEGYGYTNIVADQVGAPAEVACDFICDTENSYNTYVVCTETSIITHEDLQ